MSRITVSTEIFSIKAANLCCINVDTQEEYSQQENIVLIREQTEHLWHANVTLSRAEIGVLFAEFRALLRVAFEAVPRQVRETSWAPHFQEIECSRTESLMGDCAEGNILCLFEGFSESLVRDWFVRMRECREEKSLQS